MSGWYTLRDAATGDVILARVKWCDTFWTRFRGLQLHAPLDPDEGLLIVYSAESVAGCAIHMFFMRFAIAAIWLDRERRVVDMALAKPWRPYYAPNHPAQYVLEAMPEVLERVTLGGRVEFEALDRA